MSFIIDSNSVEINAIPGDKVVLSVNKGAMLRDIRVNSSNKITKSGDKGSKSRNKGTMLSDKGVMSSDKGALSVEKRALSVRKAQILIDFEVFDKIGII